MILDSPYVWLARGPLVSPLTKPSMTISHNLLKLNLREQLYNICVYVTDAEYYNHVEQNYNFLIAILTVDLIIAFFSIL